MRLKIGTAVRYTGRSGDFLGIGIIDRIIEDIALVNFRSVGLKHMIALDDLEPFKTGEHGDA